MEYGYIGLGVMGGALARRLLSQHGMVVFDLDAARAKTFEEFGATAAGSATEVADTCDVIALCLPTSEDVRSVLFGEDGGIAETLRPGMYVIDQTSGDPRVTRQMADELARRRVHLVDAPVSGGPAGAAGGTIAIMVGATEEEFARVHPFLGAISPNIFHAGGVGAGHMMKLVNNMMSNAQRLLTFEAVALAAKGGLEPRTVVEILQASGGRNAYIERVMIPQVVEGQLDIGYTLGLAHKDIRLACEIGSALGVPSFYGDLTRSFYQMFVNENGSTAEVDTAAVIFDRMAGTEVTGSGASARSS